MSPIWIDRHKNDTKYDDPHHCQMSCKFPGPGCKACTNETYFHCNDEKHHCVHPDLVCDGHPKCPNSEDENFDMCKEKYFSDKRVNKFATIKCKCKIYPQIFTIATACNGIEECFDGSDEHSCKSNSFLILFISIVLIVTLYLALRFCYWIDSNSKERELSSLRNKDIQDILDSFEENHDDPDIVKNTNFFFFHKKYSLTVDERKKIFSALYEREEKIHNNNKSLIFQCIHKNLDPILVTETIETKFPGITEKITNFLESAYGKRFINNLENKITENERWAKTIFSFKSFYSLSIESLDLFKDGVLAISLFIVSGGFEALMEFPTNFTSVVTILMISSIILPLFTSIIHMLLYSPNLINDDLIKKSLLRKVMTKASFLFASFLNPLLIRNSLERTNEKARMCAKKGIMEDTITLFQKKNLKGKKFAEFKKMEFGKLKLKG